MPFLNTSHNGEEIKEIFSRTRRVFFVGIGGVHMAALAEMALARGWQVEGSDRAENTQTAHLRALGIRITVGHTAASVLGSDLVVYTLAVGEDNPECRAAKTLGIPLFSRADFLGALMSEYGTRIGVAGSHGKSTVTAMLGDIFAAASRFPTVVCGAVMHRTGSTVGIGKGKEIIYEACEYKNSFLQLPPSIAVVLNAELDHVDFFPTRAAVCESFVEFASMATVALLPEGEEEISRAVSSRGVRVVTFGEGGGADYRLSEGRISPEGGRFCFHTPDGGKGEIILAVHGAHNLKNALAAASVADMCGIDFKHVRAALAAFRGAARRMEYRGIFHGAAVYDDYAHHPTEIRASIAAARMLCRGRLTVIFQPHTYSRTAAFLSEFAAALSLADRVILADIYAAREQNEWNVSSAMLAARIGERACAAGDLSQCTREAARSLGAGDLLLVMGAGDIDRIFWEFFGKDFTL